MQKFIISVLLLGTISGWGAFFFFRGEKQIATPASQEETVMEKNSKARVRAMNPSLEQTDGNVESPDGKEEKSDKETLKNIKEQFEKEAQESVVFYSKMLNLNEFQSKRISEISQEFNRKYLEYYDWVFKTSPKTYSESGEYDAWFQESDRRAKELNKNSLENRLEEVLDDNQKNAYAAYKLGVENAEAEAYAAMRLADDIRKEALSEKEKDIRFSDYAKEALKHFKPEEEGVEKDNTAEEKD